MLNSVRGALRRKRTAWLPAWLLLALITRVGWGQEAPQGPILYFFTNPGCAPCKLVEPNVLALQNEGYPVRIVQVNQNPGLANQMNIDRTPTLLLFDAQQQLRGRTFQALDTSMLRRWFAAVGMVKPGQFAGRTATETVGLAGDVKNRRLSEPVLEPQSIPDGFSTPTMHRGVAQPANDAERRAMNATVRLKVEDTAGTSFATGTVIHTRGKEALVMTCGHVFRDSGGKGVITAEYNFYTDPQKARGKLLGYESDFHDVALVALEMPVPVEPVSLAMAKRPIQPGADIFSIGCDRGSSPTIRRSKIKNKARYDDSPKYDIFGRPVIGRSGGGLFTTDGKLIGVCNAAAVEVDEGIYSAVETLHWQLGEVGLSHLFDGQTPAMTYTGATDRTRVQPPTERFADSTYANAPAGGLQRLSPTGQTPSPRTAIESRSGARVVIQIVPDQPSDRPRTIRIDDPTPELLDYLKRMQR